MDPYHISSRITIRAVRKHSNSPSSELKGLEEVQFMQMLKFPVTNAAQKMDYYWQTFKKILKNEGYVTRLREVLLEYNGIHRGHCILKRFQRVCGVPTRLIRVTCICIQFWNLDQKSCIMYQVKKSSEKNHQKFTMTKYFFARFPARQRSSRQRSTSGPPCLHLKVTSIGLNPILSLILRKENLNSSNRQIPSCQSKVCTATLPRPLRL